MTPDPFAMSSEGIVENLHLSRHAIERYQERFDEIPDELGAAAAHLKRRLRAAGRATDWLPHGARLDTRGVAFFFWDEVSGITLPVKLDAKGRRPFVATTVVDRYAPDDRPAQVWKPKPARPALARLGRLVPTLAMLLFLAWLLLDM